MVAAGSSIPPKGTRNEVDRVASPSLSPEVEEPVYDPFVRLESTRLDQSRLDRLELGPAIDGDGQVHIAGAPARLEAEDADQQDVPRRRARHEILDAQRSGDGIDPLQNLDRQRIDGPVTRDGEHARCIAHGSAWRSRDCADRAWP